MPERIQRKRTKGWRMPGNTVYVGRPTKFGNHFEVGQINVFLSRRMTAQDCVNRYKAHLEANRFTCVNMDAVVAELKGKNLACWCRLSEPCHADVLLELANHATS